MPLLNRNRSRRNDRAYDVRLGMYARVGYDMDIEDPRFAAATPLQRATALVVECGDMLLELLIDTATSKLRVGSRRHERRRDEKALTDALEDGSRVERAYVLLAHGLVQWTLGTAQAADARADVPFHEAALRLLQEHYESDEDDREVLRAAPQSDELGFFSEEHVLAAGAFDALLGDRADVLALFEDPELLTDRRLLEITFSTGAERYVELLTQGVVHPSELVREEAS